MLLQKISASTSKLLRNVLPKRGTDLISVTVAQRGQNGREPRMSEKSNDDSHRGESRRGESRRGVLRKAAGLTGLAAFTMVAGQAEAAGMSQAAAKYQNSPKNGHECDGCALYIPGPSPTANGKCKVVNGSISPKGWCQLWSPKAS